MILAAMLCRSLPSDFQGSTHISASPGEPSAAKVWRSGGILPESHGVWGVVILFSYLVLQCSRHQRPDIPKPSCAVDQKYWLEAEPEEWKRVLAFQAVDASEVEGRCSFRFSSPGYAPPAPDERLSLIPARSASRSGSPGAPDIDESCTIHEQPLNCSPPARDRTPGSRSSAFGGGRGSARRGPRGRREGRHPPLQRLHGHYYYYYY